MPVKRRPHPRTPPPAPPPAAGSWRAVALILVVGALTFANSLAAPFLYDDAAAVVENTSIQSPALLTSLLHPPRGGAPTAGRPLANFSFALNWAIGGAEPRGYHAVNVALHLACALLLFAIVRRTLVAPGFSDVRLPVAQGLSPARPGSPEGRRYETGLRDEATGVALVCALIWMVHPLQSEVADYVSARTESLMALFFLLTLYCGIRAHGARTPAAWQIGSVIACALGVMCKESMAVVLPVVALYDRTFWYASWRDTWRARWPLYLGLAATWVELAWLASGGPRGSSAGWSPDPGLVTPVTTWVYLLNQAVVIVHYLRLAIWPIGMVLDYGVPRALTLTEVAPQLAVVALLGVVTLVALARAPAAGFLGAWFFVTLAPSSSVVPIHTEVAAERRMYLASMALVVLAVVAVYRWVVRRNGAPLGGRRASTALAAAAVVVGALAALTVARNAEYASPLTMWRTVVERWPNGRARWALAEQLKAAGRGDEVLPLLRAAADEYPDAHLGIGQELFAQQKYAEAVEELDTFVRRRPMHINVIDAHAMAGRALAAQGKVDEAIARFRLILTLVPRNAAAHGRLGDLYFARQRFADAVPEYAAFLSARPREAGPWTNYAISLSETGRIDEAVRAFERALALDPASASVQRNLAAARELARRPPPQP